ncbi:hypothetical protein AAFC00_004657 [Neodothiora populina]|uniref:Nicotinamide N-methyltransferase n=1 Tax=Neodothiora populina TaxID=2781224 RepID=A0ABR3P2W4_9PEZI
MSSLTDLIKIIPPDTEETPEDIFASAPGFLFTDDLQNLHGSPGDIIIYKSKPFGEIALTTCDPAKEDERTLFSHYLWNAGVLMAERVSGQRLLSDAERSEWSLKDHRVLELGAGVGLAGIVAALAGAKQVTISDYPAPVILTNIKGNVKRNMAERPLPQVVVEGHEWGQLDDDNDFARENKGQYSRIIAADCFWMPGQHRNLARSMLHFLSASKGDDATALVIGGFHTGRAKLAAFFHVAEEEGLGVVEIYEEDANGVRREWAKEKDGGRENVTERKRWLTIARLKRNSS